MALKLRQKRRDSIPYIAPRVWILVLKLRVKRRIKKREMITRFLEDCHALHPTGKSMSFMMTIRQISDTGELKLERLNA